MGTLEGKVAFINCVPSIEPSDVSEAVARLCSDAARYVTGIALPIDAGNTGKLG